VICLLIPQWYQPLAIWSLCEGALMTRRRLLGAGAVLAVAALALAIAWRSDDRARPTLHRPAAAAWCPSVVIPARARKLSDAHHGAWDARAIIGLDLDDARRMAGRHGCQLRPVGGEDVDADAVLTADLRFNRINVDVTDGVVTALDGGASGDVVG
jgi:hypothetical protein